MTATLGIYAAGVLLLALAGAALRTVLWPGRSPLRIDCIPLGASVVVLVLYLAAYPFPAPAATYGLIVACAVLLAVWAWRRRRAARAAQPEDAGPEEPRGRPDVAVLAIGLAAGLAALAPVLQLGFPTTIGATIADGWSYVSELTWLRDHGLRDAIPAGVSNPLVGVLKGQVAAGFGQGFELLGTAVLAVTGRAPYEVVGIVSALAFPIAVIGWAELWAAVRGEATWAAVPVAVLATSPLLVTPFSENQAPHALGLAMMPYALACAVRAGRGPGWRPVLMAAVTAGGTLGVYTSLLPWIIAGGAAAFVGGHLGRDDVGAPAQRARSAGLGLAALALSVVVVAAIPVRQALRFIGAAGAGTGVTAPPMHAADEVVLATGAGVRYAFGGPQPTSWGAVVGVVVVLASAVVAVAVIIRRRREAPERRLAWVLAGAVVATAVTVGNFALRDSSGYGVWKALISGGAIVAGVLVVALIPGRDGAPWPGLRFAAAGACAVVWAGTSAALLQGSASAGQQGFRAADVQMGRALDALPEGTTLLVEGVDPGPAAFRMRMMSAYFGTDLAHLQVEGVGTTASYIASGGQPEWRPVTPWSAVLTTGPQVIATRRRPMWANGVYTLAAAPDVDVTPYGPDWYAVEQLGGGSAAWTQGDVELVVSNRSPRPRRVRLALTVGSYGTARTATLSADGARSAARITPGTPRRMALTLTVPGDGVAPVTLGADGAPLPAPGGDPRRLSLLVQDVTAAPL